MLGKVMLFLLYFQHVGSGHWWCLQPAFCLSHPGLGAHGSPTSLWAKKATPLLAPHSSIQTPNHWCLKELQCTPKAAIVCYIAVVVCYSSAATQQSGIWLWFHPQICVQRGKSAHLDVVFMFVFLGFL